MGHFRPQKPATEALQEATSPDPAFRARKGRMGHMRPNRSTWIKPKLSITSPKRHNGPRSEHQQGVRSERGATRRDEGRRRGKATHHAGQRAARQEEAKSAATSAMQGRCKKQNNGKLTQTRPRGKPRGADREKGEWHCHLRAAVEGRVQGAHPGLNPVSAASGVPVPREGPPTEQRRNPEDTKY